MKLSERLLALTQSKQMLRHPFYKAWEKGELSIDTLRLYARQYYHHVQALPRYISATHANCTHLPSRQILLENLIDEERGEGNHPARWMRFATGLGQSQAAVEAEQPFEETAALVQGFMSAARKSYASGVAALFVYEQQFPAVARSKAQGLKSFYGINDDQTLDYFTLHAEVDIEHSDQTRALVDALPQSERSAAEGGAFMAADALWSFLSRMEKVHSPHGSSCEKCEL